MYKSYKCHSVHNPWVTPLLITVSKFHINLFAVLARLNNSLSRADFEKGLGMVSGTNLRLLS